MHVVPWVFEPLRLLLSLDVAHRPPIDLYGLHARYANAVYTAASKVNALEKVEGELLALKETAAKSKYFSNFLENPLISRDAKEKNVISLLKGKTTPTTLNLMTTLAGNARLSELTKDCRYLSRTHEGQTW